MQTELVRRSEDPWGVATLILSLILLASATLEWARGPTPVTPPGAPDARPGAGPEWFERIQAVDTALAREDLRAAKTAWLEARQAVLRNRSWDAWIDLADALLRLGEAEGSRRMYQPQARQLYLNALLSASEQQSKDGLLRTANAFAALGDRLVTDHVLTRARNLP